MKRRAARVDANHGEIVKALRRCGCSVQSLAALGNGVPDLLVARCARMWLMEIKNDKQIPSKRKLTKMESTWISAWRGPVYVVNSVEEALQVVGVDTGANLSWRFHDKLQKSIE